jgi:hypothetical protein
MRTGSRPDGSSVDGELMPWKELSVMLAGPDDMSAIYAHLQELGRGPPRG